MSIDWDDWEAQEEQGRWPGLFGKSSRRDPDDIFRGVAWGWLAMLPLLLAYEFGVAMTGGQWENTSSLALFSMLRPLGEMANVARWLVLLLVSAGAAYYCLKRHWALGPRLFRTVVEGMLAAMVLGPVLVLAMGALGDMLPPLPPLAVQGGDRTALGPALLIFGGAAYEELVFRLGIYAAIFVLVGPLLRGAHLPAGKARVGADLAGLFGSALAFAAFHLDVCVSWLGVGGESFDAAIFTYRILAGVLLGCLFRLRGPGVAAWTHGLFNLGLLLGAGPDVFR
ncbi:MAG: hypothetical protein ACI8QC_000962 [Planctomycetota bacterium]